MSTDTPDIDQSRSALLMRLRTEHRDLDHTIAELQATPAPEALAMQRMKKRKLQLKDCIARLESDMIPDEPA
ncbi:YdcH family protein [Luteimonas fraxinea]|uniref:YdcH family protein n=1 Tax=Luteimonas fraxinea TaxID=2901869 RepID=A0ABS8UHG4_9GAMM|nr:YdcH family protein [Luteimonas fraxinea]MCD9098963.1 YdcH family protein [Luteimonas fraxinea]MCD9127535.1 YdcH family protein [Luteimonas fraxinea]UHH08646.1 YdcH family protein [Luteimonas fraxinea]